MASRVAGRVWSFLLFFCFFPESLPAQQRGRPAIGVLFWAEQMPPVAATARLEGRCLILSTAGLTVRRPILAMSGTKPGAFAGYTISPQPLLSGGFRVYSTGPWYVAVPGITWLDTLSVNFDPPAFPGPLCPRSVEPVVSSLSYSDLVSIQRSSLIKDSLESLTGPLKKAIGYKTTHIRKDSRNAELAGYDPRTDSVFLSSSGFGTFLHLRYALLHEFGHRYDHQNPGLLARGMPDPFEPSESRPDAGEYKADMFAFAVSLLSLTALPASDGLSGHIEDLFDRLLPGTVEVASRLSGARLYRAHPRPPK